MRGFHKSMRAKAKQSSPVNQNGLLRRFAPRNDELRFTSF
jgi:hypothetical protein